MVSSYMPDVSVAIAFNAGYTTPAASRTWTDVSSYAELHEGIDIDFGRQDERSTADANSLTLTLDNTDGRFTAGRSGSPYYPNVKIGRPVRVSIPMNLITNPSFEVDATGWTTGLGTLTSTSAGDSPAGSRMGNYVSTSAATPGGNYVSANFTPALPGDVFTGSASIKMQGMSSDYQISLLWYNGGAFLSTTGVVVSSGSLSGATYTRISVQGTAPASTTQVRMQVHAVSALTVGTGFCIDAAQVTRTAYLTDYADGSSKGCVWTGTAHNSTTIMPRFTGFIDEWPVEWEGTDAYAKAKIRASSRMARLGLGAKLRSMIESEILQDRPTQYYTLGDPSGSDAAVDSSGTASGRLLVTGTGTALTFGQATGPETDGLTALTLAGGQYLTYDGSETVSGTAQSVSCFMLRSGLPAAIETLLSTFSQMTPKTGILLRVTMSGLVEASSAGVAQVTSATNVCDGATHHVAVTRAGATWNLYIDGVLDATTGAGSATAITSWTPMVGEYADLGLGSVVTPLTGTVAHATFWPATTLSATRVAAHASAGAPGERTDQRLLRILGWAGVASTEVTTETGVETMTYQQTSGQSVVDALREVESTESGVLFDRPDGNVGFHNRSHRYLATAAATLNMASQHVGADYSPKLDRSALVNDASVSNPTTGESARSVSTTSSDEYGIATASATSVADSYDPLQQKAFWLVASYAEPRNRVPSLTVDVIAHQGLTPSAQTLLGITVGDLLAVSNAPTQSDTTSPSYFVEGYSERIGPESYQLTFNLSPTYPTLNTFVLNDATRGVLNSAYVLAL